MFFSRAKDSVYQALLTVENTLGLTPKQAPPKTGKSGDVYLEPTMTSSRDEESGQFLIRLSVIALLSEDWTQGYKQADSWLPELDRVLSRVMTVTDIGFVTLGVEGQVNGQPALVLTGVRE